MNPVLEAALLQLAMVLLSVAAGYAIGKFGEREKAAVYLDMHGWPAVASQIRRGVHRRKL